MIGSRPEDAGPPEWAVLFYLCGHFHRADRQDPFAAALDDIRQASSTLEVGVAAHLDLESGARRLAMRPGDAHHEIEALGTVNSGDPDTLDRFLSWSFDVCPAPVPPGCRDRLAGTAHRGRTRGEDDEDDVGEMPAERTDAGEGPIGKYCVRLASLERGAILVERRNRVTRRRLAAVLAEMDAIGGAVDGMPDEILQRLARCGSLLGDDILFRISDHLATITGDDGRLPHLVIQIPRELMPYPWELLRDRHGFLVERFAIGRQVIAESETAGRWAHPHRHGPLRLLVVAPRVARSAVEHATAGHAEGARVAECFARLAERLPGLVERLPFAAYVGADLPVDRFRDLLREGEYDVVHFAGHGRYDRDRPEHSAWQLSDGPLYAFELRHTLANARRTPWLVYGSACEAARESGRGSHQGVYGMASAALMEACARTSRRCGSFVIQTRRTSPRRSTRR